MRARRASRAGLSARVQVDPLDAALGVVLRLAYVVVADDALRVVLRVEEDDGDARPEEEPRHHVRGRRARVGARPAEDADGAESADARAAPGWSEAGDISEVSTAQRGYNAGGPSDPHSALIPRGGAVRQREGALSMLSVCLRPALLLPGRRVDHAAAQPGVDRARDSLLAEGRDVAGLDHGEQ
eukprot:scaffold24623_cov66-Phaeocystis_antarctica.AAC.1